MRLLMTLLLASLWTQYLPETEVKPLSFDAEAFKHEFNSSEGRPRVVTIFSPT